MEGQARIATPDAMLSGPGGNIALQKLRANNWDIDAALRTNATLPKDAWIAIDKVVLEVAAQRLIGIADLRTHGLTRDLTAAGLGAMYDYWQTLSEGGDAEQSMTGIAAGAENTVDWGEQTIPLPITFVDFRVPIRKLIASEQSPFGLPIDTTMVASATRKVIEKLEETLFNGSSVVSGGNSLYGYIDYPHSNFVNLTGDWHDTPANSELDVRLLIAALEADRHHGPFILYVHSEEWNDLRARQTDIDKTYLDIIKGMAGIEDVKVSDALEAGNIVLAEMTRETVDLDTAVDIKVVEWETHGGMQTNFKVMCVIAPRVKSDYDNRCGVAYDNELPT